jgi:putative peptide zinc metalloprotease protein
MIALGTRSLRTRIALLLALVATALGGAGVALATSASGDTSAVAVNTQDGSSVFKLAFEVRKVMGDTVDEQNAAIAYSSCEACRTVAISIQILLVGDPSTFTPTNYAVAINENCIACETFAFAYQFAVGVGTELRFTREGWRRLREIQRQLRALGRDESLTGEQLAARVDSLMGDLGDVLRNDLVPVDSQRGGRRRDEQRGDSADGRDDATPDGQQPPTTQTTPGDTEQPPDDTVPPDDTSTTPGTTPTTPGDTSPAPDDGTATTPDGGSGTTTTPPAP